ncbi:FKBP-type peptidyl-prolyl cis-trans isomerase [uncultured Sphingomonas sp.]|uniref:FKBP-type peptidyl-prolyl cis-trans isomerase n=1 Tax=uncultured Sphingomonas sp. TaxID=158754 RepID=UPI0035CA8FCA
MSVTAVPLQPVKRSNLVWLWVGIVVLVAGAFLLARQGDDFLTRSLRESGIVTTKSGLRYKVLKEGTGPHPTGSDVALINYVGKLRNGTVFDQSRQPTPMPVKGVVPGFSEALKLMNKGAKYRVWLTPALGYGAEEKRDPQTGEVVLPANSTLVFDVDLLEFLPQAVIDQYQQQQMMGGGAGGLPGGIPGGPGAPDGGITPPPGR